MLVSLLLAAGVFLGGRALGDHIVNNVIYTREKVQEREEQIFKELCAYIRAEGIRDVRDDDRLRDWFQDKSDLIVYFYDFNPGSAVSSLPSARGDDTLMYSSVADAVSTYALLQSRYADYWYHGLIEIRGAYDFPIVMRVMYFPMYKADRYVTVLSAVLAFACFALCLTLLVRRKTRYIALLSRQVNQMAVGELGRPLTVRGRDELASLAQNMDKLRLSFIERLAHEDEMNKNASKLLTDMSHDLRTPLTALMGYLEILDGGKAATPDLAQKYIASAKKRAYQIKGMTDELFEYFLVYSFDEQKLETETLDAATVFAQLWEECAFSLESEGFTVHLTDEIVNANVEVNVNLCRRVLDNIASNIIKYADRAHPVEAKLSSGDGLCCLTVENAVGKSDAQAQSSLIGLNSCKKIAGLHGGKFDYSCDETRFSCSFYLPVLTK